jgi:hypothetical protein
MIDRVPGDVGFLRGVIPSRPFFFLFALGAAPGKLLVSNEMMLVMLVKTVLRSIFLA